MRSGFFFKKQVFFQETSEKNVGCIVINRKIEWLCRSVVPKDMMMMCDVVMWFRVFRVVML